MDDKLTAIAASFDARAGTYNQNDWHRRVADALVARCALRTGDRVLDAGTGTGFVAVAAARAVGPHGKVTAVDLSAGMLAIARRQVLEPGMASITWRQGDAAALSDIPSGTVDAVLAAAVLLYMSVPDALAEWHRLLKPGGIVAFTTMRAGSPLAGRLFREAAAAAGITLDDPSAQLGSEAACDAALQRAGFVEKRVTSIAVPFSPRDGSIAWVSNLASPAHAAVHALSAARLAEMKADFEARVARAEHLAPGSTASADVLLATGVRPSSPPTATM
jgi:ubiquinone/menaquinone biosynthesis C-methylase UbiE